MRLFAIRHGATESWRERRFAGSRDVPLAADGRLQAEAVAQALREAHVAAVYSSPLERARASAEIIAAPFGLDVCVEPAFRDIALGAWEGLTRDEVATRFPAEMATWTTTPHLATLPGGETVPAVSARVLAGLAELRAVHEGETIVLVSHAMVLRVLVLAALGLGPERLWAVDASVAGITEIEYHGEWATVHRMNTLAHLDGLREGVV
jgi:broad specificity phosphatase PhoE